MPQKIVAGNWKMNTSREEAIELIEEILAQHTGTEPAQLIVCPPFTWITLLADKLAGSGILVGAQNVSAKESGAFTGEVSASMLRTAGASAVIIGHSERRAYYGETDEIILEKCVQALKAGLIVILCCGETREERESGRLESVLTTQLNAVLPKLENIQAGRLILAYEPVWAIGTGLTATPEQAEEVHTFIRKHLSTILPSQIADSMSILYGGSCNATNAAGLFSRANIDGGLIGGASLKAGDFLKIARSW